MALYLSSVYIFLRENQSIHGGRSFFFDDEENPELFVEDAMVVLVSCGDRRVGLEGRSWVISRNDFHWVSN